MSNTSKKNQNPDQASRDEVRAGKEAAKALKDDKLNYRYRVDVGILVPIEQKELADSVICPERDENLFVHVGKKVVIYSILANSSDSVMKARRAAIYRALDAVNEHNQYSPNNKIIFKFVLAHAPLSANEGPASLVGPVDVNPHAGIMTVNAIVTSGIPANVQHKDGKAYFTPAYYTNLVITANLKGEVTKIVANDLECKETRPKGVIGVVPVIAPRTMRAPWEDNRAKTDDEKAKAKVEFDRRKALYDADMKLFTDGVKLFTFEGTDAEAAYLASPQGKFIDLKVWDAVGDALTSAIPPMSAADAFHLARRKSANTTVAGSGGFGDLKTALSQFTPIIGEADVDQPADEVSAEA